jgi:uncharacterized membrane protein YccF (DUF307 family)
MTLLLNILWFIFGGWISGLLWILGGVLLAITFVGLPYSGAAFRMAGFAFWPFGKEVVSRDEIGEGDIGTGPLGFLLNVIWFLLAGWYIALSHLIIAFAEAITIIGLPFAFKDLQLAGFALAPIGKTVIKR